MEKFFILRFGKQIDSFLLDHLVVCGFICPFATVEVEFGDFDGAHE